MKLKTRWTIEITVFLLPAMILFLAGLYWLWLNHFLWIWIIVTAGIGLAGWFWGFRRPSPEKVVTKPQPVSTGSGETDNDLAWKKIEAISSRITQSNPNLGEVQFYIDTLIEVVQTVAEHYHPERKEALLEVRIPYLLAVVEMVAKDLRVGFAENIPASHIITLNDIVRGQHLASQGLEIYRLLRLVAARLNPVAAMVDEMKSAASKRLYSETFGDIKRSFIDNYIRRIGYYAIELYSGNLVLDKDQLATWVDRHTRSDMAEIKQREDLLAGEPLRILIMGQTNAGKSSLVNALFGALKAETDAIPSTEDVMPYWLERPGLGAAIIHDCEGYGRDDDGKFLAKGVEAAMRCDMILLVISVVNAARDLDQKMLRKINETLSLNPRNKIPPVIIVLTHIDQLRPVREWKPPYNIADPDSIKATMIRQAIERVAEDLNVHSDQIAAVSLAPGRQYNVEEGLIPTILQQLDEAQGIRYTRCLRSYHQEDYWRRLWTQSRNAGRFIAKKGFEIFEKKQL